MFKPIKDFITFIQKNTSINDGETGEEITEITPNKMDNTKTEENNDSSENNCSEIKSKSKETNVNIIKSYISVTANEMASDFDEDDIELQIKSSKLLKNPVLKSSTPSPTLTTSSSTFSLTSSPCSTTKTTMTKSYGADLNQNLQQKYYHFSPEDDDELGDFKNDPLQGSYEDFHSVHSELEEPQINSADEGVDESRTKEEENPMDDKYNPNIHDNEIDPVKREIFVVIENDLNALIVSPSVDDPLAIDITNPLQSSATEDNENDELSTISGINWIDTEDKNPEITLTLPTIPSLVDERPPIGVTESETQASLTGNRSSSGDSINISQSEEPTEEMERCDNSDSGLGIETSSLLLQTTINNSITENSSYRECNQLTSVSVVDGGNSIMPMTSSSSKTLLVNRINAAQLPRPPLRSNLKRRYCDEAEIETDSLPSSSNTLKEQDVYSSKKPKRSINFDAVQVYYFPRQQGFGCVPSAGGCTLGMGNQHVDCKRLTLAEHAAELRRAHRMQLQEINPRGSSSEDTDESEEDYLSEGSGSDLDADSNGFLQPVPPKQRRAILKAAGIRKIDTSEKVDCRNIRNSREVCGCTCRDFCDPETCSCSRAGIKCQVDRAMFPCGCSRDACGNTTGRVEFNPARVRTHFIHTIMRLDMENRQQQHPMSLNGARNSCGYDSTVPSALPSHTMTSGAHNGYYNMQTQSNYSSGYASPAYTNEHNTNYYQQQSTPYVNAIDGVSQNTTITPYHSLDTLDGVSVPSYGEIIPNYCANTSSGNIQYDSNGFSSSIAYTAPNYLPYETNQQRELDANSSFLTTQQHHHNNSGNNNNNNRGIIQQNEVSKSKIYSSCAEPSLQPYGVASTTTRGSSPTTGDDNFISLSTPIVSSSRLSQINDLLEHNRNTTATLVAVSHNSGESLPITPNSCADNVSNLLSSIETPTFNDKQKEECFVFESDLTNVSLGPSLDKAAGPQNEAPPVLAASATTPSIEHDSRVALADYTI